MFTAYDKDGKPLLSATTFDVTKSETKIKFWPRYGEWKFNEKNGHFEYRVVGNGYLMAYIPGLTRMR